MAKSQEELQRQLEEEKVQSKHLMEEAELIRMQQELEAEKLKQKQWQVTIEQLQQTREHAEKEHAKYLEDIKQAAGAARENTSRSMLEWFKAQTDKLGRPELESGRPESEEEQKARLEREARDTEIKNLQAQQEQIAQKLAELTQHKTTEPAKPTQDLL